VNFRESYGLKPKATYRCPECGLETKPGKRCGYHANSRPGRSKRARMLRTVLRQSIDEARA
jgi:hypothetical protein